MTLGGILILVLLVISLFVFIYLLVITARSWGVLQSILLTFLFIECWTFLIFAAGVLDRRLAMLKEFSETSTSVQKLKKDNYRLTWGGENLGEAQQALVPLASAVKRETADRGRVWRGASNLGRQGELVRLELAAAPAAAPADGSLTDPATAPPAAAPAATVGSTIPLEMVVYAFSQTADEQKRPLPQYYLGEFKVVESKEDERQVALMPTEPLEPNQLKAIEVEPTWILYELLPQDSHETFAADGSQPSPDAVFGRMDEQVLSNLFAEIPDDQNRRENVIQEYLRDGQASQDGDPPRNVWFQVEVVKALEQDVDSDEQANATVGGYFDASGRTVDVRIKREEGKKVTLPEGKQLLLPQEEANKLINAGSVKLIQRVFVRPLNAYEKGLGHLKLRRDEVERMIEVTVRETRILEQAKQLGDRMISERQVESQKLAADRDRTVAESSVIQEEAKLIADKYEQTKSELIRLYQMIHAKHDAMLGPAGT